MMRFPRSPYLLLVMSSLIWSGNFVVGRGLRGAVPPITLAFWRWTVALAILLPLSWSLLRRQWPLLRRNGRILALNGLLGVAGFNTLLYIALQSTTATNALLIDSTIPVFIALLSWLFGEGALTRRQLLGVLVSLAGVITIICRADMHSLVSFQVNRGDLWVLLAVVCWALYTVLLRRLPAGAHSLAVLTVMVVAGLAGLVPFYLWELGQGGRVLLTAPVVGGLAYVGLFASVLAFIMWNRAVQQVGPNRAGLFVHLMPLFGTILSVLFLGESFHLFHLSGMALIFSGIYLATSG
jgi:drug/metabolite transporter (DMT)-like permease